MELTQETFDALVHYTLRVELLNGKVLIYPIDAASKHYVSNRLQNYSDSWEEDTRPFPFLWFETVKQRNVIIANDSIARVTICSDLREFSPKEPRYHDNFNLIGKEPILEEWETDDGETELHVFGDDPPQTVIYHRGNPPDDGYSNNPLTYNDLEEGCLGLFGLELDGECPLRRFIYLADDDGEENFIPTAQILVMEFDHDLLYQAEDPGGVMFDEEMEDDEPDEDNKENKNRPGDLPF